MDRVTRFGRDRRRERVWQLASDRRPDPLGGKRRVQVVSRPLQVAEFEHRSFGGGAGLPEMASSVIFQDMALVEGQQRGQRSRGYQEPYLAGQEGRVRAWPEHLHDYLEGRR